MLGSPDQAPHSEASVDEGRVTDVSIAFSRHFGNYGYGESPHIANEDPSESIKRKFLKQESGRPLGSELEAEERKRSLERIKTEFPEFAGVSQRFDDALIRAEDAALEQLWAVKDYSFSRVRSPLARRLLARLNVALSIDGTESDVVSEQKLAEGGIEIKAAILGPQQPATDISTVSDVDVVRAVYDGRLVFPLVTPATPPSV